MTMQSTALSSGDGFLHFQIELASGHLDNDILSQMLVSVSC